MIDSSKFSKVRPEHVRSLSKDRPQYNIERMKREEIPEAVKVLVSNEIFGFSLTRKSWGKFDMTFVKMCATINILSVNSSFLSNKRT
jgi:hypothetical protein